ncbi:complex III assembly factor LYRM7 [Leptidea sinapis]|uniref:Complex III assembly factor LYRM7 n=1 Tax=Leptidea sinapis TaxID=189913 RepID=A0A5E4R977_9NEOP|nr:complex III assembly factor LYRM7 [Leptidea sinapis]VVD05782.1 unnamed protein product [Leptidea sinapis]
MDSIRKSVLMSFKKLHRTRNNVFKGDVKALNAARVKINEEYKKNKHVTDTAAIQAMIKFSTDVENELRTQVIQAKEVKPGVFEARITDDTVKLENVPFDEHAVLPTKKGKRKSCCQDEAINK